MLGTLRELDCMVPVFDGVYAGHHGGDFGEGTLAVDHLVQDAAHAPDVAGFAEFEVFGSV